MFYPQRVAARQSASNDDLGARSENVLRRGWLQKQNPHGLIYKQWKKRYFTLTDTALLYAKSENDAAICEVPLNRIKGVEKSDGQGRDWCLKVATNLFLGDGKRRVYVLQVLGFRLLAPRLRAPGIVSGLGCVGQLSSCARYRFLPCQIPPSTLTLSPLMCTQTPTCELRAGVFE
jgi:hypothetical protein